MRSNFHRRGAAAALLAAACLAGAAHAQTQAAPSGVNECGSLQNGYGPYDYRTQRGMLKVVEDFHFSPTIEMLVKPTRGHFGDLDYTLRASPNHHRALIALASWSDRTKSEILGEGFRPVECYFDRAMRFAKDDLIVRMIYAGHLGRTGREKKAVEQLDFVAQSAGENAFTHYNAGLLYLELKQYDKALAQAHAAMQLGLPRTELRDGLKKAGKWSDPPPAAAAAPQDAASGAGPAS